MWPKAYRDYKVDKPLIKYQIEPSHGIIGCEMHEINGWGNTLHFHPEERHYHFHEQLKKKKEKK